MFTPNINHAKNVCYMNRFPRIHMRAYASVHVRACVYVYVYVFVSLRNEETHT